jgi:crotonobetainyl-CoA:carnitine CoA-transferase CaiB-like acyl-CoA transferase
MFDQASRDGVADWARSGLVWLTGHLDGPPLVPPGNAASLAGRIGARLAAAATGEGSSPRPDSAGIDAVRLNAGGLLAERAAFTGYRRQGRLSAGGASRLLPTADGWAVVSCARPDDPSLLAALVGAELPADPWPAVAAWLRIHSGPELAERAGLLGLAAAPVDRAAPPSLPRAGRLRSPAGLLVIDFSALWAGPLCAHLLTLAGADVVKVETAQRLDGARRGNPGFYDLLHGGQRSVLLDPATPGGRRALAGLVAAADIVIEASRPRALAGFGLDAEAAADQGTIWVSITAAGRASPRIGFGDDVAASAGLVACDEAGEPVFCGDALADPLTGLVAAELAMSAPAGGRGMLFDVAMTGVVAATLVAPPGRDGLPSRHAQAARREGQRWVVDGATGPVPVARPRARQATGRAPAPGEHTEQVLRELRIRRP